MRIPNYAYTFVYTRSFLRKLLQKVEFKKSNSTAHVEQKMFQYS